MRRAPHSIAVRNPIFQSLSVALGVAGRVDAQRGAERPPLPRLWLHAPGRQST